MLGGRSDPVAFTWAAAYFGYSLTSLMMSTSSGDGGESILFLPFSLRVPGQARFVVRITVTSVVPRRALTLSRCYFGS
jgi:hypothetical protein